MKPIVWMLSIPLVAVPALAQYGPTPTPQPREARVRPDAGSHEVTGQVRSLDRGRGLVVLDAGGETLRLRYPPPVVARLSPGDRVTARLAIEKAIEGTSSTGAGTSATEPETGSPGARPPGAER
jgi:hypothetical protein